MGQWGGAGGAGCEDHFALAGRLGASRRRKQLFAQTFTLVAILAGRYYAYLFTTAWLAYEFAGTMIALAAYLYQSLPPGPAHAGAASALGLMLLAEAGLFIKRCDDEAMRRKAD